MLCKAGSSDSPEPEVQSPSRSERHLLHNDVSTANPLLRRQRQSDGHGGTTAETLHSDGLGPEAAEMFAAPATPEDGIVSVDKRHSLGAIQRRQTPPPECEPLSQVPIMLPGSPRSLWLVAVRA